MSPTPHIPFKEQLPLAVAWSLPEVPMHDRWRHEASCRSVDPDLFFPVGTTGMAVEQIESAKAVCDECPVSGPCLEFALSTNQDSGVWGGTSEEERRTLRRQWLRHRRAAIA